MSVGGPRGSGTSRGPGVVERLGTQGGASLTLGFVIEPRWGSDFVVYGYGFPGRAGGELLDG
jgi:hypothetical protein